MAMRASKSLVHASEANYAHLFADTLDGMLVFDAETMKVVLANQAAADITGFGSPDEMTGVDIVKGLSEGDGDRLGALLTNALRKEQNPLVEDVRSRRRMGEMSG